MLDRFASRLLLLPPLAPHLTRSHHACCWSVVLPFHVRLSLRFGNFFFFFLFLSYFVLIYCLLVVTYLLCYFVSGLEFRQFSYFNRIIVFNIILFFIHLFDNLYFMFLVFTVYIILYSFILYRISCIFFIFF